MIWILFCGLILQLLVIIIMIRKNIDLSEPAFLFVAPFLLSTFFVILNYQRWHVEKFSFTTVKIILLGALIWILGAILGKGLFYFIPKKRINISSANCKICIDDISYIISILIILVSAFFYLFGLVRNSGIAFSNLKSFMTVIRPMLKDNKISIGMISTQLFSICRALAYVFTFAFIWNFVKFKIKEFRYLLPVICYLIMSLLTSGRIYLIYYIIYAFTLFFLLAKTSNYYSLKDIVKVFIKIIFIIGIALVLFAALANIVGRNTQHSIFGQISVYVGGPLVSFDKFLSNPTSTKSAHFGQETLIGVYQVLGKLGLTDVELNRHLEYVQFGENWGNVYTAFRRYIHDFGFTSAYCLTGLISFVFTFAHEIVAKKRTVRIIYIIYAMLAYPIPMMVIDDVLLSSMLSINTIYDLIYVIIIYKCFIRTKFLSLE